MKQKIILICLFFLSFKSFSQTTRYVTENGAGSKTGVSWANASDDLQKMINLSSSGDQVFVAVGKYLPKYLPEVGNTYNDAPDNPRDKAFLMKDGVKVYGGFDPANNITDLSHVRIVPNKNGLGLDKGTILSGDLDGNDTFNVNGTIEDNTNDGNAYHVVLTLTNTLAINSELNGLVITGGNANGDGNILIDGISVSRSNGGGVFATVSLSITNCYLYNNYSSSNGAGIYSSSPIEVDDSCINYNSAVSTSSGISGGGIYSSLVTIENSSVSFNLSKSTAGASNGAGVYGSVITINTSDINNNENNAKELAFGGGVYGSSITINDSKINNNTATSSDNYAYGGGMHITSSVTAFGSEINNNGAYSYPALGATSKGGGIYVTGNPVVTLTNCSISNNSSPQAVGGGIFTRTQEGTSVTKLTNCILINNSSPQGSAIYKEGGRPTSSHTLTLTNNTIVANKGETYVLFVIGTRTFNVANTIIYANVKSSSNNANSTLSGGTKNIRNSLVQGENSTTNGNLNAASASYSSLNLFNNAANGDYSLKLGSAAINAGSNSLYSNDINTAKDFAGNPRLFAGTIDMGAYENQNVTVLPVNFGEFTTFKQTNNVKLTWNTLSETNNKGFLIEKSTDGINFSTLAFLESEGTDPNTYTAYDKNPTNGTNYYRLIQQDNDGKTTELGTRALVFSLAASDFKMYPNPTDNLLNVSFAAGNFTYLQLTNIQGKVLQSMAIKPNENSKEIAMAAYPLGIYMITLSGSGRTETSKIMRK